MARLSPSGIVGNGTRIMMEREASSGRDRQLRIGHRVRAYEQNRFRGTGLSSANLSALPCAHTSGPLSSRRFAILRRGLLSRQAPSDSRTGFPHEPFQCSTTPFYVPGQNEGTPFSTSLKGTLEHHLPFWAWGCNSWFNLSVSQDARH